MARFVKSGLVALVGVLMATSAARAQFRACEVSGNPAGDPLLRPIGVTHAPGDYRRVFVWEKAGRIRTIDISQPNPVLQASAAPFLNITAQVGTSASTGEERGLLGLAFHPQFQSNGKFYVYFSSPVTTGLPTQFSYYQRIVEYTMSDPLAATAAGATTREVMRIPHPAQQSPTVLAQNHNGGWIAFGPDGFLYIASGDGGNGGDTGIGHTANIGNGLDTGSSLGKILRIDVNSVGPAPQGPFWATGGAVTTPGAANYGIPADNPVIAAYPGSSGATRQEIWAYGLRNPWRNSFDRLTGDLWIADVGQGAWEEINFQPALTPTNAAVVGGWNYGWRCFEGTVSYTTNGGTCPAAYNAPGWAPPLGIYPHAANAGTAAPRKLTTTTGANITGVSITGGYVYRGCKIPELYGQYLFSDYLGTTLYSTTINAGTGLLNNATAWTGIYGGSAAVVPPIPATGSTNIVSFGEDAYGEVYIVSQSNADVTRLVPISAGSIPLANPDFDRNGVISVGDIFAFLTAWFAGDARANYDRSTAIPFVTVGDIFAFLTGWFRGCAG